MKNYNLEISYNKDKKELEINDGQNIILFKNVKDEHDLNSAIKVFLEEKGYTN